MPKPKTSKNRVTTSIKVDPAFWKEVKLYCLKNDIEVSQFIEKALRKSISENIK